MFIDDRYRPQQYKFQRVEILYKTQRFGFYIWELWTVFTINLFDNMVLIKVCLIIKIFKLYYMIEMLNLLIGKGNCKVFYNSLIKDVCFQEKRKFTFWLNDVDKKLNFNIKIKIEYI